MMRRELLLWSLAAVAGIGTAYGMRLYLRDSALTTQRSLEQRFRPAQVVVARTNLAPGTLLEADSLALRRMPADYLPAGSLRHDQAAALRGRVLEHALAAGEPVQTALLRPLSVVHLAERVPLGRRAVTIAVDESNALAGLLRPGDRVDVSWSEESGRVPRTLANLPVLAVGDQVATAWRGDAAERFATVTLEVDLAAARLLAGARGRLALSLRNPRDTGADLQAFGAEPAPAVLASVTLIVGGQGGPTPALHRLQVAQ